VSEKENFSVGGIGGAGGMDFESILKIGLMRKSLKNDTPSTPNTPNQVSGLVQSYREGLGKVCLH